MDLVAKESEKGIIAAKEIKKGDVCFLKERSLQLSNLNHSCNPNVIFDPEYDIFIAYKNISKSEELLLNYLTVYRNLAGSKFACGDCEETIRGYDFLDYKKRREIVPLLRGVLLEDYISSSKSSDPEKTMRVEKLPEERYGKDYNAIMAARDIEKGEIVYDFRSVQATTVRTTGLNNIQVDDNLFIIDNSTLRWLNHSCNNPNLVFDSKNRVILSIRPIKKDEELTVNYNTVEFRLENTFDCNECRSRIGGYAGLDAAQKMEVAPLLRGFLFRRYLSEIK